MKRFLIDGKLRLYYENYNSAVRAWPSSTVAEIVEKEEQDTYIDKLLSLAKTPVQELSAGENSIRQLFRMDTQTGECEVMLAYDPRDHRYYEILWARRHVKHSFVQPVCWDLSTPKAFYEQLCKPIQLRIVECGRKVKKPEELRGVPPAFSVTFIPRKCMCQAFILGVDLYIKHNDFFSPAYCRPEDIGMPLSYRCKKYGIKPVREKLIYADNWGAIVIGERAWLKFENAVLVARHYNRVQFAAECAAQVAERVGTAVCDLDPEWASMFEEAWQKIIA